MNCVITKNKDDWDMKVSADETHTDYVKVIRCKDCKYSESVPKWKDFELGCMLHREYTTATDFCSQAGRKEAE